MKKMRVLEEIRKRPGLYLGKKSLYLLKAYINGYTYGINEYNEEKTYNYFLDFQSYVENRLSISKTPYGWDRIINSLCESEEEAFDKFFELYDEFMLERDNA